MTWYRDADGDGYGSDTDTIQALVAPSGYIDRGGDCGDNSPLVYPGALEYTTDNVDNDCDGLKDELQ